jgi:putative Holliday junction resolvase
MRGVRLAVDVGSVRVGVATSDPEGRIAMPLTTLRRGAGDLDALAALVAERSGVEVVIGLPKTLAGREGASVTMAREYATALGERIAPVPVLLVDERLTSVVAQRQLRAARAERPRGARAGAQARAEGHVDSLAAAGILQTYLDGLAREGKT